MRGRFTLVIAVVACGIAVAGCAPPAPSPTASSTSSVVSTTPVPSSTATTTPVRTNTNGLPVLPRIQVNRVPADGTVSEELLAGVQRFADDLADGNLDGVVAQCWAQASSDLRARWSDETTRRNALAWLSQPPRGVVGDWVWGATTGEATPDEYVAFGSLQPAGYACPTPLAFTPAQAALIVQRMVDTHNGTPYDGQGTVIDPGGRRCVYQPMTYGDWTEQIAGDVMSKAPGAIGVCHGVFAPQWDVLAQLAGRPLAFADPATLGLGPQYSVATADPADGRYAVFGTIMDGASPTDVILIAVGDTTHLKQPHIQVNGTSATGGTALTTRQLAAVQRFVDDVADGNVHSIVTNCWTQAEVDVEAKWSDPSVRAQALTWLTQPTTSDDLGWNPVEWGPSTPELPFTPGSLAFTRESLTRTYACPLPDDFTGAQAQLTIQRLIARHDGTPLRPDDTAANYPKLSCDEPDGLDGWWMMQLGTWHHSADYVCAGPAKGKPIETQCLSCSGTSDKQWLDLQQYLAMEMKQGNTLKLIPASTIGLNDDLFRLVQGPFTPYWVLFAITGDGHYPLIAIGSTVG